MQEQCLKEGQYDIMMRRKIRLHAKNVGTTKFGRLESRAGNSNINARRAKRKFIMELNYSTEFKQKAIVIFFEGNSGRAVGRIMGINKSKAYNWIKKLEPVHIKRAAKIKANVRT